MVSMDASPSRSRRSTTNWDPRGQNFSQKYTASTHGSTGWTSESKVSTTSSERPSTFASGSQRSKRAARLRAAPRRQLRRREARHRELFLIQLCHERLRLLGGELDERRAD